MKELNVDAVVGHGSAAEYDRILARIKKRATRRGIGAIIITLLYVAFSWGNWGAIGAGLLASYFFWESQMWQVEAFEAVTERGKDSLRHGETLKKIMGPRKRGTSDGHWT
jgi:hypothetical protein